MLYVTVADVALSAVLYALVAIGVRDAAWARRRVWTPMIALAGLGTALAVAIELHALGTGRWSYSELMPLVPLIGAGALPVVQLALVTAASTWIGHYLSARTAGSSLVVGEGRGSASAAPGRDRTGLADASVGARAGSDQPPDKGIRRQMS